MTQRVRSSLSFYGPMAAIAAVWLVCAVLNAAPPTDQRAPANAAALTTAAAVAHPHVMGAQGTQTPAGAQTSAPSDGCMSCHTNAKDPHPVAQSLSCVDCHGGNGTAKTKEEAHVKPKYPD